MSLDRPDYSPIDCGFYDRLEASAVKRDVCEIQYVDFRGQTLTCSTRIADLYAKDGEEFMQMENGERIRLDQLVAFNGHSVPKSEDGGHCRLD